MSSLENTQKTCIYYMTAMKRELKQRFGQYRFKEAPGVNSKVVNLQPYKDPDELLKAGRSRRTSKAYKQRLRMD